MERYWMESNIFSFDCIGRSHVFLFVCLLFSFGWTGWGWNSWWLKYFLNFGTKSSIVAPLDCQQVMSDWLRFNKGMYNCAVNILPIQFLIYKWKGNSSECIWQNKWKHVSEFVSLSILHFWIRKIKISFLIDIFPLQGS